jgi:hypothetical protein
MYLISENLEPQYGYSSKAKKEPRKMETKLRWHIFMGYDDGLKSIKYYNVETCKVLTSQIFISYLSHMMNPLWSLLR